MSLRPPANPPQPQPDWTTIRTRAKSFSPAAFDFIRDGLAYAVEKLSEAHGPGASAASEAESLIAVAPPGVRRAIGKDGNAGTVSRHISGQQLCGALRHLARDRYGMLALTVLHRWGIRTTEDFGVMVYALIDRGEMRSSHNDRFDDFVNQYDFAEAFAVHATV